MVTATRERKPSMSPEAARSFQTYSVANAVIVRASLPCGCQPYEDVFTFNRWIAQGFCVKRGEHSIKLACLKHAERENKETGEVEIIKIFGSSHVFCRHQVAPLEVKA